MADQHPLKLISNFNGSLHESLQVSRRAAYPLQVEAAVKCWQVVGGLVVGGWWLVGLLLLVGDPGHI